MFRARYTGRGSSDAAESAAAPEACLLLAVRRRCRLLPRRLHRMRGSGTFLLGGRKLLKKNATTESLQTKKHRRCGKSLVDFESALPLIRQNGEKAAGPGRGRSSGETAAGLELGRLSGETAEGPRTARLLLSRGPRAPGPPVRSLRGPMPPTPRAHPPTGSGQLRRHRRAPSAAAAQPGPGRSRAPAESTGVVAGVGPSAATAKPGPVVDKL
jgi:hypothetical protein